MLHSPDLLLCRGNCVLYLLAQKMYFVKIVQISRCTVILEKYFFRLWSHVFLCKIEFQSGFVFLHLWSENGHFCQKCPSLRPKKWHFEWPNQNSKTTFIVQTFPKYGLYDFYLVNLSLLGAILAIFQFCGFSGLFWPFFPCNCNV